MRANHVMLWVSHVLIRHSESSPLVSFDVADWRLPPGQPSRNREEARALAEQVAVEAQRGTPFAELARVYSEDPTTRAAGGSLGGIPAYFLSSWPQVLDALTATPRGRCTRVVETEYGFHVFERRRPPPERTLSGARIVIGHEEAPWLEVVQRRPLPKRSRTEALALAQSIYERARSNPGEFERLVDGYSEHRDAARAGDFGSWSTLELTSFPRELEVLQRLSSGEVAPPIESLIGVQVIQRAPERPRQEFAMVQLQLRFDASLPDEDPHSKRSIARRAHALAPELARDPERFAALRHELCCARPIRVIEGRDVHALERALAELQPGQIAEQPIEDAAWYLIPQRLDTAVLPPPVTAHLDFGAPDE